VFLYQPILVFQVYVPLGGKLSIEFSVSDIANNHRRFFFSTCLRESKVTALHASFKLSCELNVWQNLKFDMADLVNQHLS
jgi:hypothetical protein